MVDRISVLKMINWMANHKDLSNDQKVEMIKHTLEFAEKESIPRGQRY